MRAEQKQGWAVATMLVLTLGGVAAIQLKAPDPPPPAEVTVSEPLRRPPATSATELPHPHTPLATSFPALAQAARQGQVAANRRLLRQLEACARLEQDRQLAAEAEAAEPVPRATDPGPFVAADLIPLAQAAERMRHAARDRLFESEDACVGVTAEQLGTRGEWLQRLEATGDPEAALCYVLEGATDAYLPARYSDEWIAAMRRYRERSPAAAQRVVNAGLPIGAFLQYEMLAPPESRLGLPVVHPSSDPERAYALALVLARLHENGRISPMLGVIGDWRARANLLASALPPSVQQRAQHHAVQQAARLSHPTQLSGLCPGTTEGLGM